MKNANAKCVIETTQWRPVSKIWTEPETRTMACRITPRRIYTDVATFDRETHKRIDKTSHSGLIPARHKLVRIIEDDRNDT